MAFQDYFSKQSDIYLKARPGYPDELFKHLAALCREHKTAWDCATGNGQAAVSLTKYFNRIVATDGSEQQLKNAVQHPKITYRKALAESSDIESESIHLITVANALHWFNLDGFFKEADRVLAPGGVLAVWTYSESYIEGEHKEEIKNVMEHFARKTLDGYWPAGSRLVMNGYKDIKLPFEPIPVSDFVYTTEVDLAKLLGFFYSWSSVQRYISQTGNDPVANVKNELLPLWGKDEHAMRTMTWILKVKAAKK